MNWRVFVHLKPDLVDHHGEAVQKEIKRAKVKGVKKVRAGQAYELSGELAQSDVWRLAERLLSDPVTQEAAVFPEDLGKAPKGVRPIRRTGTAPSGGRLAEVWPRKGVTDPVADTVLLAAKDLGVKGLLSARSGRVYDFFGKSSSADVKIFCEEHLMNPLVQSVEVM